MGMRRVLRTAHDKVDEFRVRRSRQPDPEFLAECDLPDGAEAVRVALAVRRAVGSVGLVDPLFIRASDRFPEELGVLPLWDSLDWMGFVLALEWELEDEPPREILDWRVRDGFSVKQLVQACYAAMA